ncbi:cupin domain-containing protein [Candidatus Electronema sp. JC]|uniref:cupin domain-containing protein n=1 Tax=Candidatus Electronema sp. JC TaxID=3401570 RepID=UPI003AA94B2E
MTAAELIRLLQLEPHPTEGGYFRRTYESALHLACKYGERKLLTSIYYLLTQESPGGFLHRNRSDILHYHQCGAAVKYLLISPEGSLSERILGPDITHGESLQLLVPGGWWKASRLCGGEYSLISEAVAPGFDYADNEIATDEIVQQHFPAFYDLLAPYLKHDGNSTHERIQTP